MDPFHNCTMRLYTELIGNNSDKTELSEFEFEVKWKLLACELVLKEHDCEVEVYLNALKYLTSSVETTTLTDNDWLFAIDSARKSIKRFNSNSSSGHKYLEYFSKLLDIIIDNLTVIKCTDSVLRLLKTCQDYSINFGCTEYLDSLYLMYKDPISPDDKHEEFYFINCEMTSYTMKRRCQRWLILLNPSFSSSFTSDYLFNLFSASDSELIRFMKSLFNYNSSHFYRFYSHLIVNELISVDLFIEQLLTDSIELLELLLSIFSSNNGLKLTRKSTARAHFRNFHVLLLLKVEGGELEFPFNPSILIIKLNIFINKI